MSKANMDIRSTAKQKGVFLWEIAESLNIQESRFSKVLRTELSCDEKRKIFNIIDEIANEKVVC